MKKILVLVLALAFLLPGCSAKSNLKEYDTGMGLELYLPAGFDKFDSEDFPYAISNEDNVKLDSAKMVVFVVYEGIDGLKAQGLEYKNIREYGEAVSGDEQIKTTAGVVGDRYIFDYDSEDFYYKVVCLQGNEGYYIVNFCCFNDSKELPSRFDEYAKAIVITPISGQLDYQTFDNGYFTIDMPYCMKEDEENIEYYTDYVDVAFDHYDSEAFESIGYSCPATEKEAIEVVREYWGDTNLELLKEGDMYYYIYQDEEHSDVSVLFTLKKASDGYLACRGRYYEDMTDMEMPLVVKWFNSIKVNF
ncbi:MAG: hypothetical protein K6A14_08925 [Erysipelotrichaceae bacterium]|nr:hypothetical protein [Erysipelotrichaceae bacterium]